MSYSSTRIDHPSPTRDRPTKPSLAIVVPCFNEEDTLDALFERLGELGARLIEADKISAPLELILVDDGSIDGFGAAYAGGVSGVFMVPMGETLADVEMDQLNGTFDNISAHALPAVPEPNAGCLLAFGLFGIIGFRRRNRQ